MSGAAGLDVRYPIGGLFTVLGLLLAGYGAATRDDARLYARATGVNVNLWWGLAMLAFGLLCLALAARGRGRSTMRPAEETEAGRETERRERVLGLEE
ncbi:MAG: hypothetical protein ACXWZS_07805 [Gemmatirosa sp.]